jgi:putative oxidoreductase
MTSILNNKYLLLAARIVLAFVFIYAAAFKISDPESFAKSIANYRLLPLFIINIFAILLPWIEIVAAIFLLFGISVRENSLIITSLLFVFTVAVGISVARGLNIECGCFGTASGSKVGIQKILENTGLLILGFWLVMKNPTSFSFSSDNNS